MKRANCLEGQETERYGHTPVVLGAFQDRHPSVFRIPPLAARMGYRCQMAFYSRGLMAIGLPLPPEPRLIAVEVAPPHDVAVYRLDENVMYAADEEVSRLLRRVAEASSADRWEGKAPSEEVLALPVWSFPNEDADDLDLVVKGQER